MTQTSDAAKKFRVLIVEDEPLLLMQAADFIADAGFDTLEARDADEAIRLLETHDDIRIVFTDVDMPGSMDGLKLAAAVRGRWPPIEIIVTSAYFNVQAADLPERGRFFKKPYQTQKVIDALREMTG